MSSRGLLDGSGGAISSFLISKIGYYQKGGNEMFITLVPKNFQNLKYNISVLAEVIEHCDKTSTRHKFIILKSQDTDKEKYQEFME